MAYMSYPWRILVPLGFYLSVISGFVFSQIKNYFWQIAIIILGFIILIYITKDYRKPLAYVNRGDMFYITNQATTIEGDENTPVWVKNPPRNAPRQKIEVDGSYQIEKQKSNLLEFSLVLDRQKKIIINTIYYPGWNLFINNKKQEINYNNDKGLITFFTGAGKSNIKLSFTETPLRAIADLISLTSALVLFIFFIFKVKLNIRLTRDA
jgi:hypothetical protein